MNKRGQLLIEYVIGIILNIIFISILIGFIYLQGQGKNISEESYSKQIALLIDASNSDTDIIINMKDALDKKDKDFSFDKIVRITENTVYVKLSESSQAEYKFFNDVQVVARPYTENEYVIIIRAGEKNEN